MTICCRLKIQIAAFLLCIAGASNVLAALTITPALSSDGNYQIGAADILPLGCSVVYSSGVPVETCNTFQKSTNGTSFTDESSANNSISGNNIVYSAQPDGTYYYRARVITTVNVPGSGPQTGTSYTNVVSITVDASTTPPPPPPVVMPQDFQENRLYYIPGIEFIPIIFYEVNKYGVSPEDSNAEACDQPCPSAAINAGAVKYDFYVTNDAGLMIVYFNSNGKAIGYGLDLDGDGIGNLQDNDIDGDGVINSLDDFPENSSEWLDSDNDGVGDNTDAFPYDPAETKDSDGDGVGDNADAFPMNAEEWVDSNGNGIGDNFEGVPADRSHKIQAPLKGQFNVDSSGNAIYQVPFDLPPSINGNTPQLGLSYSSGKRRGSVRMGWSIDGLSAISRCPAKQRKDGFVQGVEFDVGERQRFCLDGQPLILIDEGASTYGAAGSIYTTEKVSPIRIKVVGQTGNGPNYFIVKTGDGKTSLYGQQATSKHITNNGDCCDFGFGSRVTSTNTSEILTWKIDSVTDRNGNKILYQYHTDTWNTNPDKVYSRLHTIRYDGNIEGEGYDIEVLYKWEDSQSFRFKDMNVTSTTSGYNALTNWVTRAEAYGSFAVDGMIYGETKRLSSVVIRTAEKSASQDYPLEREYDLVYEPASLYGQPPINNLKEINVCTNFICADPIAFDWELQYKMENPETSCSEDLNAYPGGEPALSSQHEVSYPFDDDFGWGGGNYRSQVLGDYNGDDLTDIAVVYTYNDGSNSRMDVKVAYSTGAGRFNSAPTDYSAIIGTAIRNFRLSGDFNNDGYTDLVSTNTDSSGWRIYSVINNRSGGFDQPVYQSVSSENFYEDDTYQKVTGDANGDGNLDIIAYSNAGGWWAYVALGNGDGTFQTATGGLISVAKQALWYSRARFTGDFNGDGITDIALTAFVTENDVDEYSSLSEGAQLIVAFGTESGTFSSPAITNLNLNQLPIAFRPDMHNDNSIQPIDINGDGLTDIFASKGSNHERLVAANGLTYWIATFVSFISKGDGTFDVEDYLHILTDNEYQQTNSCSYSNNKLVMSDFNSDGFADFSYGSGNFYLGRGDGKFLAQGRRASLGDIIAGTGGGLTTPSGPIGGGIIIADTTYGAYAFDVNRDGNPDVVEVVADENGLRVGTNAYSQNVSQQYLKTITEPYGKEISIGYVSIASNDSYIRGPDVFYPLKDIGSGKTVVDVVFISNGVGGTYQLDYSYENLVADLERRELLGFEKISVRDTRNSTTTTTEYYQQFPLTGAIKSSETRRTTTDALFSLSSSDLIFESTATPLGNYDYTSYLIKQSSQVASSYNFNGDLIGTVTTTYQNHDEFGQAETITTNSSDGYGSIVQLNLENSAAFNNFYVGRLKDKLEIRSGPDYAGQITRVEKYEYLSNGLVDYAEVEPNNNDLYVKTDFDYDTYGRVTSATVSGSPLAQYPFSDRTSLIAYIMPTKAEVEAGNYEMEIVSTNAEEHQTKTIFDIRYGHALRFIDENDLTTRWEYNTYGDLTKEIRPDNTQTTYTRDVCETGSVHCPNHAVYRMFVESTGTPFQEQYIDIYGRGIRTRSMGFNTAMVYQDTMYNSRGQVYEVTQPYYTNDTNILSSMFSYDILGRLQQSVTPEDGTVNYRYNARLGMGTRVEVDNIRAGLNGTVTLTSQQYRNLSDQPVETINAENVSFTYKYDAFGNLKETTDPDTNKVSITYDSLGRPTGISDPDLGIRTYGLDALGQQRYATDANNRQVTLSYDDIGRLVQRTKLEGADTWAYDNGYKAMGKLVSESTENGVSRNVYYDQYGRVDDETHTIEGEGFTLSNEYDAANRLSATVYPTGFRVDYDYDVSGYLKRVYSNDVEYWRAVEMTASGQLVSEAYGNDLNTITRYNDVSGRVDSIETDLFSLAIKRVDYEFDSLGNLEKRIEQSRSNTEAFTYDNLNRLKNVLMNDIVLKIHSYDDIGNIEDKSDYATNYQYGLNGAGPHAVSRVTKLNSTTVNFSYDNNGNMLSGDGYTVNYNSFNKPTQITSNGETTAFDYGPNQMRAKQVQGNKTTVYINPRWDTGIHYERETTANVVEHKHYINAGGVPLAVYTTYENSGAPELRYLHKDHLGSIDLITNESGNIAEELSYQAFGERRNADWSDATSPISGATTHHGFTGHEHLEDFGLIHMNARLYDPQLGRFISADSVIPTLNNLEAFNRYSYVYNNPLSLTDPSGHYGWGTRDFFAQGFDWMGGLLGSSQNQGGQGQEYDENVHNNTANGLSQVGASDRPMEEVVVFGKQYNVSRSDMLAPNVSSGRRYYSAGMGTGFTRSEDFQESVRGFRSNESSAAAGFTPIGVGLDLYTAATGSDLITGETNIPWYWRAAVIIPGVSELRSGGKIASSFGPIHHICTDKNCVSTLRGGPWTPRFEAIFEKAGMTLNDALNKVSIPGHKGPHPEAYHQAVFDRLTSGTDGLNGQAYTDALQAELRSIGSEAATPGSVLNKLLTKQ